MAGLGDVSAFVVAALSEPWLWPLYALIGVVCVVELLAERVAR